MTVGVMSRRLLFVRDKSTMEHGTAIGLGGSGGRSRYIGTNRQARIICADQDLRETSDAACNSAAGPSAVPTGLRR
eukprot:5199712-Heterocapsa_arctica.AAC.1